MGNKVLLIGLGNVGGEILQTLARSPGMTEIVGADIDEKGGTRKTKEAAMGAAALGLYPKIQFRKIDLKNDEAGVVGLLEGFEPDLIFNTADLFPYYRFEVDLPREIYRKIGEASKCGFVAALPFRLVIPYKLMTAVKKSGIKTHVLITNDPCEAVNPMLSKVGLAPTAGIGDFAHFVEPIRIMISSKTNTPMRNVQVFLIAHHSTLHLFQRRIIPDRSTYFLKVLADDKDITKEWSPEEILLGAVGGGRTPEGERLSVFDPHFTASIAVGDILAILNDTGEIRHCPGPAGLVGGYPVRLSSKGAEVFVPEGITLEEAKRMNEEAQKQEGIEKISDDGTVVFTDEAHRILSEVMNWEMKEFNVKDCEKIAEQLDVVYKALVNKYKKNLK
jgi:hypothetical protein